MENAKNSKRKTDVAQNQCPIPTKTIRLPVPLVNKLLDLKKRKGLEFLYQADISEIFSVNMSTPPCVIPLFESRVQAGSPSPADELLAGTIDLNEYLIQHKTKTFLVRVSGESMKDAGIFPKDLLIVDKALKAISGNVVVAILNGEFTVKRLYQHQETIILCAENEDYADIKITQYDDFEIWGVVTNVIHAL